MKLPLLVSLAAALAAAPAAAQTQDVGLTMDGGVLTVIYGQDCGPVTCTPMFGSVVGAGETRVLTQYSAPQTLYAIAFGLPGACLAVPGFDNRLLLQDIILLDVGLTSAPPFVPLPCQQGVASFALTLPDTTPPGIVYRLQSIGVSVQSGAFAFGPAIEATTV